MKEFVEKNYKKLEILFAAIALFVFLIGNVVEDFSHPMQVIPFMVLLGMGLAGNYTKVNMRVMIWLLMGIEFVCTLFSIFEIYSLQTYVFDWILDGIPIGCIIWIQVAVLLWMPILGKGGLFFYSAGMGTLFFLAAVLEGGVSIILLSVVLYYVAFMFFAYELKKENKLGVYDKLFDYFIECLEIDEEEEEFSPGLDDMIEEECEAMPETRRTDLIEKFMKLMMKENKSHGDRSKLRERLQKAVENRKSELVLKGKDFLYDDYQESELLYTFDYTEGEIVLTGIYSHRFSVDGVAANMLKKKSVLNETFANVEVPYYANVELDDRNLNEGYLGIYLPKRAFSYEETEKMVDVMFEFMKVIILLNNGKSY